MGFALTVAYIAVIYLTPAEVFPGLAPLRIQVWLVALAGLTSLPVLWNGAFRFRGPQLYLLAAFVVAMGVSVLLGQHWLGGVLSAWSHFLPSAAVFLLVILTVNSVRRLQVLEMSLVVVALIIVIRSIAAFHAGDPAFVMEQRGDNNPETFVPRLRALGIINDPNDLAQFILMILPLVWLRWKGGSWIENTPLVLAPTALLLYALFLTRSRGGLVGLAVLCALAARRRFGWLGGVCAGMMLAAILLVANFTGGREVSFQGGATRLALWSDGLQMVRTSPVWGVGYNAFMEHSAQTAHNSFLLCAAELGLPGYLVWLGFFVASLLQLSAIERTRSAASASRALLQQASALRLTLWAFLTTAWFLSRAYHATPFLILGMAAALAEIESRRRGQPLLSFRSWADRTVTIGVAILLFIYATVRIGR